MSKYDKLFEPITFKSGVRAENRIVMAPMTHYSSNDDGTISDAELRYYAERAKGPGMVVTACANVTENGKAFTGQPGAHTDEMVESMKKLAQTIQQNGAKAVVQIHHGGRECPAELVPGGDVVSASETDSSDGSVHARALTGEETAEIVKAFGEATRRVIEAGFDGVEIHGANGYLIQQFFSPYTNRREDEWGGSLEKRLAFPLAVVDAVKKTVAEYADRPFLVGYRLSPEEPYEPGITMDDTFALLDALMEKELDYVHISLQHFWSKARRGGEPGRPRMEQIVEHTAGRVPLIGVGSLHTGDEVLKAMETDVPLIALGRELVMEPHWVEKIKAGQEDAIQTALRKDDRERLVIPEPLWKMIISTPGWFPFAE
ncbi:NADH-dependent flavin oxidoreductase [Heyndrickxia coagulans]|uniref:NADH-dependent flavin oxidoreductase n=1 Tax=Heyndrickxia coagulans TaxID=1398 RepID=UPI00281132ED|nr:NADH-dependent flavin oxidoreductase [Heyndrickxia coagulans]WMM89333.1 NADH-dependent flavin oxidoreductase [Heyndrickxia coagulans]